MFLGLANCNEGLLPSFSWDNDHLSDDGIPHLKVHFPDGGNDDTAILRRATTNGCNFNGHLRDESKAYVAMTGGCPFSNTFEVSENFKGLRKENLVPFHTTILKFQMVNLLNLNI